MAPSTPSVLGKRKALELEKTHMATPIVVRVPPVPQMVAPPANNSTAAAITSNQSRLSLKVTSAFVTAECQSAMQKIYDREPGSWYYVLFQQGDIPRSALSDEGRHFIEATQSKKLVVEKSSPLEAWHGRMRFEIWPTSSKSLTSCHYRCVWQIPMAGLQTLQENSINDDENLEDSGYASVHTGDGEGDDAMEEERNDNKGGGPGRQTHEKEGTEKQDHVDDEDVSCLLRAFPIAFEVIFWNRHLLKGNYYTKCTESKSDYHIEWEFEHNAANIAARRARRQRSQGGDQLQEGMLGSRREEQLLQLLDDVVAQRPF